MSKKHKPVSSGARRRLVLLAALAAFALSLLPMSGSAAAVQAATQSWPEHLARPVPASCPAGETLIAPTSGWTDGLGVSHVTYKAAPGFVSTIPPEGLTADKVTTALIADVGMSAPAAGSSTYQRRVRQMLALARDQRAPQFCRSAPDPGTAMLDVKGTPDSPVLGAVASGNWSGYAKTQAQRGTPITDVYGAWTVPRHTQGGTPSVEGTWVGIGDAPGEANPGLIQTGTAMETNEGYRSFIEFVGGSACTNSFCGHWSAINAVSPGDSVTGEVQWIGTTSACFYFEDLSRSSGAWNTCGPVVTSYGIPHDTSAAEWINEWPTPHVPSSGGFYYDNPHTVYWSAMLAGQYGSALTSPFSGTWTAYVLLKPGGDKSKPDTCASGQWISIPIDAATNSSGIGTSQTITCYISGYVSGP